MLDEIERLQRELERPRAAPDAADIEQLASYYEHGADVDTEIAGELAQRDARLLGKALRALQRERAAHEPSAGVKCTHCNGKGYNEPIYDEQDGWTDETPCETCNGSGRITTVEQYLKTLPANWHEDSSLETWFPITAEELKRLKDERASQPPEVARLQSLIAKALQHLECEVPEWYEGMQLLRSAVTKSASECGACDKPGEHCANVHGICSRHGGRAHETSALQGFVCKCGARILYGRKHLNCPAESENARHD